ncbi:MAG: SIS domain-containing protein [Vampirovibrionia bacterium]
MKSIDKILQENIQLKKDILANESLKAKILKASNLIRDGFKSGHKVLLCGNGGSAADAQHIAAELHGKFYLERTPIPAVALSTNTSSLTAISNDISFDDIFLRQLQGFGNDNDILLSISTSGNSQNVIKAMIYAKNHSIINIALTGNDGGIMKDYADILINVPSTNTARIQEAHILIGHIICEKVETELFNF